MSQVPSSAQSKAHYDPRGHSSSASQRFLVKDACAQVMQPQTQGRPTEFTNLNILQFKMTKTEQLSPEKNTNPLSASIQILLHFWCFHFLKSKHLNLKIVAINCIVVKNKDLRSRIPEFEMPSDPLRSCMTWDKVFNFVLQLSHLRNGNNISISYICCDTQVVFYMQSTKSNAWLMVSIVENYIIVL